MIKRFAVPVILSVAVLVIGGRAPSLLRVAGPMPIGDAALDLPRPYIATSPISRLLDALTLLSVPQSVAIFLTIALALAIWFGVSSRRRSWKSIVFGSIAMIGTTAIVEGAVALLPRPMARLTVTDTDAVIVDFHSHTGSSHDVRKSYSAEDNRRWHRGGGFHVAWVTDHVRFDGAVAARRTNPPLAGGGTVLLTGVEGRYHKIISTIMLGLDERDAGLLNGRGNLLPGNPASGRGPVTIVALPNRHLDSVTLASLDSLPRFVAIELIDAAPRGLGQFDREEARIRELAARLRLTMVAASNNHGYGYAVAAWNVLRVPGWRGQRPEALGELITDQLRDRNPGNVSIVMRNRPRTAGISLPLTLPVMLFQVIGALGNLERIVWLVWIWGLALLSASASSWRTRRGNSSFTAEDAEGRRELPSAVRGFE